MKCIVCESDRVESLGTVGLRPSSVTSDSKPCPLGAEVFACNTCGHLQKHFDERTKKQVEETYATYAPHHLSQGHEQPIFVPGIGPRPRTYHTLAQCQSLLPAKGRLLDVGCGNGAVLRSAGMLLPGWDLHGFDLNDKHRDEVLKLPGVSGFTSGSLAKLPPVKFDLIVLWHTLEHIPDASASLRELRNLLAPSGLLLIQVPDLARTPFDLLVIDHASHFTFESLATLCRRVGFGVKQDGTSWIHNCLTVMLAAQAADPAIPAPAIPPRSYLSWVNETIQRFETATRDADYALFGTGMASIALLRQLSRRPVCVMEEDEHRWGGKLDGIAIRPPAEAPAGLKVIMPFNPSTGSAIADRLQHSIKPARQWEFILPGKLPGKKNGG
jgi:2-polyprenyl-3-methyl-5-hydroxy-6-metoxy-1,4-benzoquinol methylase